MKRSIQSVLLFLLCSVAAFCQPTISNVYVSASTPTTATIVWTTNTPSTSQIQYGNTATLGYANNVDRSLVTSHSMTLTLLNASQPYYFAVVSVDGSGGSSQSSTYQFSLCGQPLVPLNGTVNSFYGNGTYTLTWNPPSGAGASPTVCGQSVVTPITGSLNAGGSFSSQVADSLKVTPGPGSWTVAVSDPGALAPISINVPLPSLTQDVSTQLQAAAASAGLVGMIANTNDSTCWPAFACQSSGGDITPSSVTSPKVTANVNSVQNVMAPPYNAKGDCTPQGVTASCTDNMAAIQAAINAAYAEGLAVFLPANSSTSPTVYYVAGTLNPKGVSIYGPPGGGTDCTFWGCVVVRGATGKDVFALGDPASGGYVTPLSGFVWSDFGIDIDDSEDVSASNTHRKPGKTCQDVTVTNDSPNISSTAQCEFVPGDIGQNVTLSDGTNTLSTTISAVGAGNGLGATTATLAANWTHTSGSNRTLYVSVMGLAASARVGNCALAYDDTTSSGAQGPTFATFENIHIATTSESIQNNSCEFFFQGVGGQPYGTQFKNIFARTTWGFWAVEADNEAAGSDHANGALGDFTQFKGINIEANYPWGTYNGDWTDVDGLQVGNGIYGPQILNYGAPNNEGNPAYWNVEGSEYEGTAIAGWRVEGISHKFSGVSLGATGSSVPVQWDAFDSHCTVCTAGGNFNLAGSLNDIEFSDAGNEVTVNDTGQGNRCRLGRDYSDLNGKPPGLWRACGVVNSRQQVAFESKSDFVGNGDELTPYKNQSDLWIWPQDNSGGSGSAPPPIVADSTSESGYYMAYQSGENIIGLLNGAQLAIGSPATGPNLPATEVHVCWKAKADSGSETTFFWFQAGGTQVGPTLSPTLTTTYSTNCLDADLSSYGGQNAYFFVDTSAQTDIAWISIHPWPDAENVVGNVNAGGFEVAGSALATGNLADWTNTGIANGYIPVWNSGTGLWTPQSAPSGSFSAGGDLTGSDTSQQVVGLEGNALPSLSTSPGFIYWNGSALSLGSNTNTSVLINQLTSGSSGNWQVTGAQGTLGTNLTPAAGTASTANFYFTPSTGFLNVPTGLKVGGSVGTVGHYFRSDGSTGYIPSGIQASDVPTLNQSTSGNAATATALVSSPSACSSGSHLMTGISTNGNAICTGHPWSCNPDWIGGTSTTPLGAGTYTAQCQNTTGYTVLITGLSCFADTGTSSTLNGAGHTLGALLTGAVTCGNGSYAAGTQSANVNLTNNDWVVFTAVADGTADRITGTLKGTY